MNNSIYDEFFAEEVLKATGGIDRLIEAFKAFSAATDVLCPISFVESTDCWRYGTERQQHLLWHGSPKKRKKWKNALLRKKRIAERRSEP